MYFLILMEQFVVKVERLLKEIEKPFVRENGHKAFLCTGRAPVSITQDILDVGFDGVISAAGSFIQIDGKYIYENFLDSKRLQQAIVLFSNAQVGFTLETKDELFQSGYARE